MKKWISEKVPDVVRKELSAAVPAATHAGKEFLKKFSEEFPKERKKL